MATMHAVGIGHQLPAHASIHEDAALYTICLDVSDFTDREVSVELLGSRVTVRANQLQRPDDAGKPFLLHERLEESFRLPDDADAERMKVFYRHGTIELHVPRRRLTPRVLPIEHRFDHLNPDAEPC
jgi:HSP20 family molecular chaperone IbpA